MNITNKNTVFTLVLTLLMCSCALAETLTVDSTTATPVWSSPLVSGTPYCIQASGWFYFAYWPGIPDVREGDANFFFLYNGNPVQVLNGLLGIDSQAVSWFGTMDGATFSTNTYSPTHIYNYYFIGDGFSHSFVIWDGIYYDNVGSLNISISPVPIPALTITPSGANCLLSWPSTAIGFNLYQNADLPSTNWLLVTNQPIVAGGTNTVLISGASIGKMFYRLEFR